MIGFLLLKPIFVHSPPRSNPRCRTKIQTEAKIRSRCISRARKHGSNGDTPQIAHIRKERLNLVTRTTHRPTRSSAWINVQPYTLARCLSILIDSLNRHLHSECQYIRTFRIYVLYGRSFFSTNCWRYISLLSYEIVSAIKFLPDEANEIINVKFSEIREALDRGYYDRGGVFTRCARLQTEVCITRMHYTRYPGHGRV